MKNKDGVAAYGKVAAGEKFRLLKSGVGTDEQDREVVVPAGAVGVVGEVEDRDSGDGSRIVHLNFSEPRVWWLPSEAELLCDDSFERVFGEPMSLGTGVKFGAGSCPLIDGWDWFESNEDGPHIERVDVMDAEVAPKDPVFDDDRAAWGHVEGCGPCRLKLARRMRESAKAFELLPQRFLAAEAARLLVAMVGRAAATKLIEAVPPLAKGA